jgi:hypothetical protein
MREAALARSIDKLREVDASLAYAKAWAAANPR